MQQKNNFFLFLIFPFEKKEKLHLKKSKIDEDEKREVLEVLLAV